MTSSTAHPRARVFALSVGALFLIAAVALGVWRPWSPLPAADPVGAGENVVTIDPAPLALPDHPRILVFGDSWTYGSAASDPTLGYGYVLADLMDGETIVKGVRGSGYLKPGLDGPTFGERITQLDPALDPDLIIIQGSINDRREGVSGYREAVTAAWDGLVALYPEAAIVVLGPAPHELPVGLATTRIDQDLRRLASARGWWYISPVAENWITDANYLEIIDVEVGRQHPSTEGHRRLAELLAAALAEFEAAPVTEAGLSESPSNQ